MVNNSLHESESHTYNDVHRFFDFFPDLFGITGFDGCLKRVNHAWESTLGYSSDELLSRPVNDLVYPDDRHSHTSRREQTKAGKSINNFESRMVSKDGSIKWFEWTAHPYPDQQVNYVVGRDVTERKQAQEALRQSEQAMRALLNGVPNRALMMQPDGTIIMANDLQAVAFSMPLEELIGKNIYDLVKTDTQETQQHRALTNQAIRSGKTVVLEAEWNGSYFQTTITPIQSESGETASVVIASHDITQLKQTENALRDSEEQFRSLVESAAEGVLLTDEAGRIILLNHRVEQMFGYSRDELLHQPVEILLPDSQRHKHIQQRHLYAQEPQTRPMGIGIDVYGKHKDGSLVPIEVSLSFLHQDNKFRVMSLISDITERKQIEQERLQQQREHLELQQEREILELRQRFMSMVSHEFRTPLTVIASSCELLEHYYDRLPKERQIEKLHVINGQVRAMVGLLDDILQLGKIQAGAVDFSPEILDLAALCNHVLSTIQIIDQQDHQLQLQLGDFVPPIRADRRMLEHAVGNLLSNAVKYSPPGSQIAFSLSGHGEQIRLEIRDEGIGIPLEDQPHLFEPFYRANNARQIEGTGLGLAIVKHNIEKHGGTISYRSIEGIGTTFTIDLPAAATG